MPPQALLELLNMERGSDAFEAFKSDGVFPVAEFNVGEMLQTLAPEEDEGGEGEDDEGGEGEGEDEGEEGA